MKNMKVFYVLLWVLLAVSILGTAVLLYISPEVLPVHFDADTQPDRMGSKFEYLVFPTYTLLMTVIFYVYARYQRDKEPVVERVTLWVGAAVLAVFTFLGFFFQIKGILYVI